MPTIDPVAAAVDAVVAHLLAELGPDGDDVIASVIRGWPEDGAELDLSGLPVVSVTAGSEERTDCAARSLGSATANDVTTHTYRRAFLSIVAQVDLWAAHRVMLDDVAPLVEAALSQAPPLPPVLRLTSTDYYGRPLVCHLGPPVRDQDGDSAKKGEWRMSWDLRIDTDIVATAAHVPQEWVDIEVTTTDGAAEVTETINAFGA